MYDCMLPGPRLIVLRTPEYDGWQFDNLKDLAGPLFPQIFHICQESRKQASFRKYKLINDHRLDCYVNFHKDTFLLAATLELLIEHCRMPSFSHEIEHLVVGIFYTAEMTKPYCEGEDMSGHIPWVMLYEEFPKLKSLAIVTTDKWVSHGYDEDDEDIGEDSWVNKSGVVDEDHNNDEETATEDSNNNNTSSDDDEDDPLPWWNDDYECIFSSLDAFFNEFIEEITDRQLAVIKLRYPDWPLKRITWLGGLETFNDGR